MDEVSLHPAFATTAPGGMKLTADELHVWAVPLHGDPARFLEPLSLAERDRAGRFHFADHRRRYEITHGALRYVLGGYLGRAPEELSFRTGPRGKPYLGGNDGPFFSLSHSGKLTLIGVSAVELGLDCEKVRHLESYREIARKHFSTEEVAGLETIAEESRLLAFYRCWTRKEAYIKALGEGLTRSLDTFDVSIGEEPRLLACHEGREEPANWSMRDVSPGPEFVAAVALRAKGPTVKTFRLAVS